MNQIRIDLGAIESSTNEAKSLLQGNASSAADINKDRQTQYGNLNGGVGSAQLEAQMKRVHGFDEQTDSKGKMAVGKVSEEANASVQAIRGYADKSLS